MKIATPAFKCRTFVKSGMSYTESDCFDAQNVKDLTEKVNNTVNDAIIIIINRGSKITWQPGCKAAEKLMKSIGYENYDEMYALDYYYYENLKDSLPVGVLASIKDEDDLEKYEDLDYNVYEMVTPKGMELYAEREIVCLGKSEKEKEKYRRFRSFAVRDTRTFTVEGEIDPSYFDDEDPEDRLDMPEKEKTRTVNRIIGKEDTDDKESNIVKFPKK